MNPWYAGLIGLAIIPVCVGLWMLFDIVRTNLHKWITKPIVLDNAKYRQRRSIIVAVAAELAQARMVRAFTLPGGRMIVIRSEPKHKYDNLSGGYMVLGTRYNVMAQTLGAELDNYRSQMKSREEEDY